MCRKPRATKGIQELNFAITSVLEVCIEYVLKPTIGGWGSYSEFITKYLL